MRLLGRDPQGPDVAAYSAVTVQGKFAEIGLRWENFGRKEGNEEKGRG